MSGFEHKVKWERDATGLGAKRTTRTRRLCKRCGKPKMDDVCNAEACAGDEPHLACEGWGGSCCYGGAEYARGQL